MTMLAIDLNPFDDVLDGVGGVIGGAADATIGLAARSLLGLIADSVASVTDALVSAMMSTTSVDLSGGFFPALTPIRQMVLGMFLVLVVSLLFLSVLRSLAAGEPSAVVRAALVDTPATILMTTMSVSVAWVMVRVVDAASMAVIGDVGPSLGELSASLISVDVLTRAGLLGGLFGILYVIGAILVWTQLLVRAALIYVLIVLAPLGLATRAHPGTRQIARRTVELGVALIVSKFAVAVAFAVGAAAIGEGGMTPGDQGAELGQMVQGCTVVLMAAFMPWLIWKVFPLVEAAGAWAGVERSPMKAAIGTVSTGMAVGFGLSRLGGGGGGGAGVGPVPPSNLIAGGPDSPPPSGGSGGQPAAGPSGPPAAGGQASPATARSAPGGIERVEPSQPDSLSIRPPAKSEPDRSEDTGDRP